MIQNDDRTYLVLDKTGSRVVDDIDAAMAGDCECTRITSQKTNQQNRQGDAPLYLDAEFQVSSQDISSLQQEFGEKIVLKRLCRLYPKQHRPPLFPDHPRKSSIPRNQILPSFIYQMQILGVQKFKSIILGNSISESGRYQIVVNFNGRYVIQAIDDVIPILEEEQEPAWSRYLKDPWHFIIIKLWAKIKGGYGKLKDVPPFEFIQHFTESNWKYFRLATEGKSFIAHYKDKVGKNCRVLLKSKASLKIWDSGLVPNRISYELLGFQSGNNSPVLIIRTGFENVWTGKLSIVDKQLTLTQKMKEEYRLNYTLTLSLQDFLNMFSTVYVTHANLPLPIYRSFYQFSNSQKFNSARYFQISFAKEGFFNFSIQQPDSNKLKIINNKQIKISKSGKSITERFLSLKYILSRKVNNHSSRIFLEENTELQNVGKYIRDSANKFIERYNEVQYDLYQTAHRHGLAKSNAHFMMVIPGTYILRVKAETSQFESSFSINYSSHQLTEMQQVFMTKEESVEYLNHNIISISDQVPFQSFSKQGYERLSVSDRTDTLGYGFAVLKLDKKCPYKVVLEVDPQQLLKQGYKLKNIYKEESLVFKVEVGRGESKAVVFKRIPDRAAYSWPSKAFQVGKLSE